MVNLILLGVSSFKQPYATSSMRSKQKSAAIVRTRPFVFGLMSVMFVRYSAKEVTISSRVQAFFNFSLGSRMGRGHFFAPVVGCNLSLVFMC